MKKLLLFLLGTCLIMALWAVIVFTATLNGWCRAPLAKRNVPGAFLPAAVKERQKQFTGNFAMAVMKNGNVESETFFSMGKPVDRNTVFQSASLSKWISAFGIMKLVEDGKIGLDSPVSKYLTRWRLPESKFNNEEVTVRRVLSHTAGLTDGLGYSGFKAGSAPQTLEQSLTKAADVDPGIIGAVQVGIKPGSEFKYSGGGYTLLQLLVEEVTGQSFATFMKETVLEPMGMVHSTYIWDESSPGSLAEFYTPDGKRSPHHRYTALAAASLYTSLGDLELFFQAQLPGSNIKPAGRNVLKPATIKSMREPQGRTMGVAIWGLGTVLYADAGENDFIFGHDGKSTPAINTAVRTNPGTGDGIIVLETGNPTLATKLASEWVFWKTGQVDTFLFPMLVKAMTRVIAVGWLLIVAAAICIGLARRYTWFKRETRSPQNYYQV